MKTSIPMTLLALLLFAACQSQSLNPYPTIGAIPPPPGFHRIAADGNSFAFWLRMVALKKDRTVYLFDGTRKRYQGAQYTVLDITVGHTDLQQCADAVMRLRAEYCYARRYLAKIDFYSEQGARFNFLEWSRHRPDSAGRASFNAYLNKVFMYCSTRTLERQLVPAFLKEVDPGDVLIKGGAPGHAMLVVDVAEDDGGHRVYLLAQSYMPAQDIHIVNNPTDSRLSPWYSADAASGPIETPEWTFTTNQLRTWPGK